MSAQDVQQQPAAAEPPAAAAAAQNGGSGGGCPPHVLEAIYGKKSKEEKQADLDKSLHRWWTEYADRKNDEEDEYVANSLLYDRNHLPRTAPAPDCVQRALAAGQQHARPAEGGAAAAPKQPAGAALQPAAAP